MIDWKATGLVLLLLAAGCSSAPATVADAAPPDAVPADLSVEAAGAHEVGTTRYVVLDEVRSRELVVQAFYPTTDLATDVELATLEVEPVQTQYADLLASAPTECPTKTARFAIDADAAPGVFPLVLFSHCHECTRLSALTAATRLASHGFVVLAVEHTGNTLWNQLAGDGVALSPEFLQVRAADVRVVLDQASSAPHGVGAAIDFDHVGVFGHSFGAVTAGLVAQDDPRIDSAMALAAPMENPLLDGVEIANLHVPLMFLIAEEDNSITALGNQFIRNNFTAAVGPAWKLEVADAGHWSPSDLVGLVPAFAPGCGDGERQTDGTPFTYLSPTIGRALTAAYVTAFFRATLTDDAAAASYLVSNRPVGVVESVAK